MKKVFFFLLICLCYLCLGERTTLSINLFKHTDPIQQKNTLRFDGIYTSHDTSKGNCGVEGYKRHLYIAPFAFFPDGRFIHCPYAIDDSIRLIDYFSKESSSVNYGSYRFGGDKIILRGKFSFFAWGMRVKQYEATYEGKLMKNGDLELFLVQPYPKVNMKLNNNLKRHVLPSIYKFKQFPLDSVPVHNLKRIKRSRKIFLKKAK